MLQISRLIITYDYFPIALLTFAFCFINFDICFINLYFDYLYPFIISPTFK